MMKDNGRLERRREEYGVLGGGAEDLLGAAALIAPAMWVLAACLDYQLAAEAPDHKHQAEEAQELAEALEVHEVELEGYDSHDSSLLLSYKGVHIPASRYNKPTKTPRCAKIK